MRLIASLLFASLIVTLASSHGMSADEKKDETGFKPLFTADSFDGWKVMGKPEGFTITDGVLRSEGAKGGDWIRYETPLDDFALRLEWKISKEGNSGVFIRTLEKGNPWETGYEVQLYDAPGREPQYGTGSLYGYFAPKPEPNHDPDVWHELEIICKGPQITVIADGVKVLDVDQMTSEKSKDKPLKGYLGLQDSHSTAGHSIEYRHVRVKRL
ncbi:MAG: DUF1080 domain-containing protein [Planctomycetaceae bacterium]